jgi:hypothetical protein
MTEPRATILCPGPSLARVTALDHPSWVLLAINDAMNHPLAAHATWWCALDLWTKPLPRHAPMGGMVTSWVAIEEGQARLVPYPCSRFDQHPKARGTATTLPAALWWCAFLGASEVQLVGCDMAGTANYSGEHNPEGRHAQRWRLERDEIETVQRVTGMVIHGLP